MHFNSAKVWLMASESSFKSFTAHCAILRLLVVKNARKLDRDMDKVGHLESELVWNAGCRHELAGGSGQRDVQMGLYPRTL